jgi:hypothetical protein
MNTHPSDERSMNAGYALIWELLGSELFGDYMRAFPEASGDASVVLRVAVSVGLVDSYQELLEHALRKKRPVLEVEWHALLAQVSWPRPLAAWERNSPEPVVIDGHGRFDFGEPWETPLLYGGSVASKIWILLELLAVAGLVVIVGITLRAFPERIANPLRSRLDKGFASFI